MATCLINIYVFILLVCTISRSLGGDECSRLPDTKVCNSFLIRTAWYYNSTYQECLSFLYGGCGNTSNVYKSEVDCYVHCSGISLCNHCCGVHWLHNQPVNSADPDETAPAGAVSSGSSLFTEKLVTLHPPWNVKAVAIQSNSAALIWNRPSNYDYHKELIRKYMESLNDHIYNTVNNSTQKDNSSGDGLVHVVLHRTETGQGLSDNKTIDSSATKNDTSTNKQSSNDTTNAGDTSDNAPEGGATDTKDSSQTTTGDNAVTPDPSSVTKKADDSTETFTKNTTEKMPQTTTGTPKEATPPPVVEEPGGKNLNISEYIGKSRVPFHLARLTHYTLSYKAVHDINWKDVTILENTTFFNLTDLIPSREYFVKLSAVYLSNTTLPAKLITFRTQQDPKAARQCYCDAHGTVGGKSSCNLSLSQLPWCKCLPGRAGLFCEICQRGYYRIGPTMPCHKCPCSLESSTGSCHFVEGYLHCLKCRQEYSGILCHRCANGYYRDYNSHIAVCRKCDGCHNIKPGLICDPYSGKCLNCHYNTTGERCDSCLPGFTGDPLANKPCLPVESKIYKPPAVGIIASVVVGTIVLLSGIVGIIVYRRVQRSPVSRPFWTIEFQEDHEGVNFSSVPDDDADRNVDDLRFYEDHQKTKSKSQPYSRLQEDF